MARKVVLNAFCRKLTIIATAALLLQVSSNRVVSAQAGQFGVTDLSKQINARHVSGFDGEFSSPISFSSDTQVELSTGGDNQDSFAMAWFLSVLFTGLISFYRRKKSMTAMPVTAGLNSAGAA